MCEVKEVRHRKRRWTGVERGNAETGVLKEEEAPGNRDSEEVQDQKAAAVVAVADSSSSCRPSECCYLRVSDQVARERERERERELVALNYGSDSFNCDKPLSIKTQMGSQLNAKFPMAQFQSTVLFFN